MNETEQLPSVEEIKTSLTVEVEEVAPKAEEAASKVETAAADIVEELKHLGRQVAETLRTAWESEERQKVEAEIREGVKSFTDEIDKVIREVRESEKTKKLQEEAVEMSKKVEESELTHKARAGITQGLRWLSEELGKLAEQFTPKEKTPPTE